MGWTLVHSLWQGLLILIVLSVLLVILRRNSAQLKYFISYAALIGILVWSSVTFVRSYQYAQDKQELKEKIMTTPGYVKTYLEENQKEINKQEAKLSFNMHEIRVRSFFQRNFYLICTFWLIGIIFLIVRLTGGFIYTRRLRKKSLSPINDEWLQKINELAERLTIRRKVESFFSGLVRAPLTLGTFKPVVLFPVAAFTGLSPREIEAIIAHELAHVLCNDYFFNIIQSVVEIFFFYHPAVWVISSWVRKERENSCDNIALNVTGDKVAFVKALASMQIHCWENEKLVMAFPGEKNGVMKRIKRLQNNIVMKTNFIEGLIAAAIIATGLVLASFANASNTKLNNTAGENQPVNVLVVHDSVAARPQVDSIRAKMEKNLKNYEEKNSADEELEKMVEVAYSEKDQELSAEMMEEINQSLQELNINEIVREAMKEASAAMREASKEIKNASSEIDREEINRDMQEAAKEIAEAKREMAEEMRWEMSQEGIDSDVIESSIRAASAGLDIAAGVVGSLDIEGIVSSALNGVSSALDAVGDIHYDSTDRYYDHGDKDDYKKQLRKMEKEKQKMRRQQEELKKQMDQLQKELDDLKENSK